MNIYYRDFDKHLEANELSTIPPFLAISEVDHDAKLVKSYFVSKTLTNLLGLSVPTAIYLGPKLGCQLLHNYSAEHASYHAATTDKTKPTSSAIVRLKKTSKCVQSVIDRDFTPEGMDQNQTRAVTVVHKKHIIAEGYQERMGISKDTKLLGWSMTKSVHSAIVGAAIQAGIFTLETPAALKDVDPALRAELVAMNGGRDITIGDLLQMKDILQIEENYSILADISTMLYVASDAGKFASSQRSKAVSPPSPSKKAATFGWYYSSGVSNVLARELRDYFQDDEEYRAFPHTHLFSKIGADSFAMELDAAGTFVASSFAYATARDWARLGELFLSNGSWEGQQVLPAEFVEFVQAPHPHSGGHYGGHFWLNPARVSVAQYNELPHDHIEKGRKLWMTQALPADAYAMNGYLGQTTMIIPSRDLVIARLGYTPDAPGSKIPKWDNHRFYTDILACIE